MIIQCLLLLCLCHICLSQSLHHICSHHLNSCCNQLTKNVLFDQFISSLSFPSPSERNNLEQLAHTQWLETLGNHCQLSTLLLQLRNKLRAEPLLDLDTNDATFKSISVACHQDEKCTWEAIDFIRDRAIVNSFRYRNATLYERTQKMLEPRAKAVSRVVDKIDDRNFKVNLWKFYKVREVGLVERVVQIVCRHVSGVVYCLAFVGVIMTILRAISNKKSPSEVSGIYNKKSPSKVSSPIVEQKTQPIFTFNRCGLGRGQPIFVRRTSTRTEMKAIEKSHVTDPRKELNELHTTIETYLETMKNELLAQQNSIDSVVSNNILETITQFKTTLNQVCLFYNAVISLNMRQEMMTELQKEVIVNETMPPIQEKAKHNGNILESKEVNVETIHNDNSSDCISMPANNCQDVLESKDTHVETIQNENSSDCISLPQMTSSNDLSKNTIQITQPIEIEDEQALDESDFLFEFPKSEEEPIDEEQEEEPIYEEPVVRFGLMPTVAASKPNIDLTKHYIHQVKTNRGVKLKMDASTFNCQRMQDLISKAKNTPHD